MKSAKLILASLGVLLIWLAVCPSAAQAETILYRIDFTVTDFHTHGSTLTGLPLPAYFTVDTETYHFTDAALRITLSTGGFWGPLFGCFSPCSLNTIYWLNELPWSTSEQRQNFISQFLNGGTWAIGSASSGSAQAVRFNDFYYTIACCGNGRHEGVSGTFTTTANAPLPESSSLFLLVFGLAGIVAIRKRKHSGLKSELLS